MSCDSPETSTSLIILDFLRPLRRCLVKSHIYWSECLEMGPLGGEQVVSGAWWTGLVPLQGRPQGAPAPSSTWGHSRTAACEPGGGFSSDSSLQMVRNQHLCSSRPAAPFCYRSQHRLRHLLLHIHAPAWTRISFHPTGSPDRICPSSRPHIQNLRDLKRNF